MAADPNGSTPAADPDGPADRQPEAEPVDLLDTAGGSVAKRAGPVVAALAVVFVLLRPAPAPVPPGR